MTTTLLGALLGGLFSLLSPCSVMLLPAFFSYAFTTRTRLIARTGVFYLGLITTLVPLGVLSGTVGAFFNAHRGVFVTVAASLVVALGLLMLVNISIPYLTAPAGNTAVSGTGATAVYLLGAVYGVAGMCAGPLLGAVLTASALGGDALYGGLLMLAFAAGMVIPLVLLSLLWDRIPALRNLIRPKIVRLGRWENTWSGIIGGILLIAVGVVMLGTDGFQTLPGIGGVDLAFTLESQAARVASQVPNWVVVAVVGSFAIISVAMARRAQRRTGQSKALTAGESRADTSRFGF